MIERAVRRSPESPDFEGLDVLLSNQFDSTGGVLTRHFDKYISEIQKNDATVLKQQRLYCRGPRPTTSGRRARAVRRRSSLSARVTPWLS